MSRRSMRLQAVDNITITQATVSTLAHSDTGSIHDGSISEEESESERPTKKLRTKKTLDDDDATPKKTRTRKPRAPKPEPVYVIPDVEKRTSNFRGRLGYACLNTILRNQKPPIFCSRTCRIDTIKKNGIQFVHDLATQNTKDLMDLIKWNVENNITFMRVSSEMFPFASHKVYGYKLASIPGIPELLKQAGDLANKHGHRLTTHPGQFTQLGSPRDGVVTASLLELEYHAEMLDLMGLGPDAVMIIHGGGVYGDKEVTLQRLKENLSKLDATEGIRRRLVLENDELCYSAEDLLPICEELDIPLVFDYHHYSLNPGALSIVEIVGRANAIFRRRGIRPKQHLSEARPGAETLMERRAHADRCERLPDELDEDMDLMIEAKDKEQAVLHLYRIYDLKAVKHDSLRPPNEDQTKETKGRKSSKKSKKVVEEDEETMEEAVSSPKRSRRNRKEKDVDELGTTEGDGQAESTKAPRKKRLGGTEPTTVDSKGTKKRKRKLVVEEGDNTVGS